MIDVHCHLPFHSFQQDYEAVAERAFAAGVTRIINTGTKLDSSQKAVEFAEKYERMYAIVGIHPHHSDKIHLYRHAELDSASQTKKQGVPKQVRDDGWIKELEKIAQHPKVIGIGEIGMDYFSYQSNGIVDPKLQRSVFEKQIALAHKLGLPLQIHQRQAGEDLMEILQYHKGSLQAIPGMFHCFAGSMEFLKSALDMGFYIGFDGNVTYSGLAPGEKTSLQDLAKYVPLERMVVETDAPFLTPVPHRGTRNEPAYVIITGKFLAEIKKIPFPEFVEQTTRNVYTVFSRLK